MTAAARKRVTAEDIVASWRETTLYPHLVRWAMTPIVVVNEANRASSEHWRFRHRRSQIQKNGAGLVVRGMLARSLAMREFIASQGASALLVRSCKRRFDVDGAVSSMKHVIDGVAGAIGVDDRHSDLYSWTIDQVIGEPGTLIAIGVKAPNQPHLVVGVQGMAR